MKLRSARVARGVGRACRVALLLLCGIGSTAAAADRVRIEIDGVTAPVAANVRAFLTLTRHAQRTDLTDGQVRRLADRAVDEATDALRPFGYYAPTIRSRTTRDGDDWIVRLRIKPGKPVLMRKVEVTLSGPGREHPELVAIARTSALQPGTQLDHATYERLKADLLRTALERGFLDARLMRHELDVDPANHVADARIEIETGGRYEFGELRIEQDAVRPELLQGFIRFAPGQPFSQNQVRKTQFALEDSNYFSTVSVSPGDRDPETLTVPVTISGERIRRDRFGVSLGYGTDTSVRGRFTWDNRLVNDRGHRWRVETTLSSPMQELIGRYIIPIGDPTLEKLEFSGGYTNEELADLDSERFEIVGGLTQVMGNWQRVLFLKVNRERTGFPDGTSNTDLLLIPGVSYASLPPNFLTGWTREAAYYLELSGSPQTFGSDASYLRFYGRAERVWPITGPWRVRARGELGTSWVDEFSELPASQRFFAGGDRSVRGFALDELSPLTEVETNGTVTQKRFGGEHKLVASLELERDLPRDFVAAAFFDTGNAFDEWGDPLEYSAGIGLRWRLPMLMIGIDVAQALSESGKNPRIHLNITQVM